MPSFNHLQSDALASTERSSPIFEPIYRHLLNLIYFELFPHLCYHLHHLLNRV